MKKYVYLVITLGFMVSAQQAVAADPQATTADASAQSSPASETVPPTVSEPVAVASEAVVVEAVPASAVAVVPVATAVPNNENLEFVSGEVTAVDETNKTVSVKLYGETEQSTPEKVVTIKVDEATDITDGEKDRDLKSLTVGTEVDVEYDAGSSKATYIFVY